MQSLAIREDVAPTPTVTLLKPHTYNERGGRSWKRGVPQAMTVPEAMTYLDNPRFRVRGLQGVAQYAGGHEKRPKANLDVMLDIQALVEDMKLDDSAYKDDITNFCSDGTPNWHAVKTILGYDVTREEVEAVIAGWEPTEVEQRAADLAEKKAAISGDMLSERGDMQVHEVREPRDRPTRRGGLTIVKGRSEARRKKNEKVHEMNLVAGAGAMGATHSNKELVATVGGEEADPTQAGAVGLDGGE